MPAQGRGRRDAEDEVDPVGAAPVEDLRAAIVAVGAQQDLRFRPVGADGPNKPAQKGADVRALRALGGEGQCRLGSRRLCGLCALTRLPL